MYQHFLFYKENAKLCQWNYDVSLFKQSILTSSNVKIREKLQFTVNKVVYIE